MENGDQESQDDGFQTGRTELGIDIAPDGSVQLPLPQCRGQSLVETKLGWQLDQTLSTRTFCSGEDAAGQWMRRETGKEAGEHPAEVSIEGAGQHLRQRVGDEAGCIGVDGGLEQRLLGAEVDVHGARREPNLAGDARHGRATTSNSRELSNRFVQDRLPGAHALCESLISNVCRHHL